MNFLFSARWALLAVVLGLSACSSLLPRGDSNIASPFESYAQAQAAADKIVPFQTRTADLASMGFDYSDGRNVVRIPYPDLLARLAPYPGVPMDALDPGIRQCIHARNECRAYAFHFERKQRKRTGTFWYDFFNIRRITHVTGWSFDALIVVTDGTVLFRNFGGQAQIDQTERSVNPLGPLQPAGEASGALLRR